MLAIIILQGFFALLALVKVPVHFIFDHVVKALLVLFKGPDCVALVDEGVAPTVLGKSYWLRLILYGVTWDSFFLPRDFLNFLICLLALFNVLFALVV